ncbi:MAG TPA: Fur family transcriptional regulator [Malonomonas sp.]
MLRTLKQQKQQLTAFEDACRKAGLRLTPQRLEVFRELARATDHPSAETLHQRLVKGMPTLSLDTVYRTLGTLASHGLINKVETVESQARFEVAQWPHHHLICRKCREIIDFQWQLIDEAALPDEVDAWGKVERKNLVAYGTCRKCL